MKKILTVLLLTCSVSAMAQHGHHYSGHRGGYGWVAPAIIGGVIGYGISRSYYDPYYYNPPPVVYVQPLPPRVIYSNPVNSPPPGYHWQEMVDPQSGDYKIVAVPN